MLCVFHPGSECVLLHLKRLSRGQHEVVCFAIQSGSGCPLTDWSVNLLTFHVLADKAEFHFWFLLSLCLSLLSFTAFFALQDAFGEKCPPSLQHPWESALVFAATCNHLGVGVGGLGFLLTLVVTHRNITSLWSSHGPDGVTCYTVTDTWCDKPHSALWELFLYHLQSLKTLCVVIGKYITPGLHFCKRWAEHYIIHRLFYVIVF